MPVCRLTLRQCALILSEIRQALIAQEMVCNVLQQNCLSRTSCRVQLSIQWPNWPQQRHSPFYFEFNLRIMQQYYNNNEITKHATTFLLNNYCYLLISLHDLSRHRIEFLLTNRIRTRIIQQMETHCVRRCETACLIWPTLNCHSLARIVRDTCVQYPHATTCENSLSFSTHHEACRFTSVDITLSSSKLFTKSISLQ